MENTPVILILPGWQDSGPEHWQSLWLKKHPNSVKVEQHNWMFPKKDDWVATLNDYIERYKDREIILVGHSLGCIAIAHWARQFLVSADAFIHGALLVAPGDADMPNFAKEIQGFAPIPLDKLTFKSILVGSDNDVWMSFDRMKLMAKNWGSQLVVIPGAGHINAAAGFGDWPEGEKLLEKLMMEDQLTHTMGCHITQL